MLAIILAALGSAQAAEVFVVRGRTMVPLRQVGETFGASVQYNSRTQGVSLALDYQKVDMMVGSRRARVGDRDVELEVAAVVVNGVTYVPARFVSDAFGFEINWSTVDRQVFIVNPKTKKQCVLVVSKHVPPGLAKKGGIPPGQAKKAGAPAVQVNIHIDDKDKGKHKSKGKGK